MAGIKNITTTEPANGSWHNQIDAATSQLLDRLLAESPDNNQREERGQLLSKAMSEPTGLRLLHELNRRAEQLDVSPRIPLDDDGIAHLKEALSHNVKAEGRSSTWVAQESFASVHVLVSLMASKTLELTEAQFTDALQALETGRAASGLINHVELNGVPHDTLVSYGKTLLRNKTAAHPMVPRPLADDIAYHRTVGTSEGTSPGADIGGRRPIGRNSVLFLQMSQMKQT